MVVLIATDFGGTPWEAHHRNAQARQSCTPEEGEGITYLSCVAGDAQQELSISPNRGCNIYTMSRLPRTHKFLPHKELCFHW